MENKKLALKEIKKELNSPKRTVAPLIQNVIDNYNNLKSPGDKNNLLKSIIKKVTYSKDDEIRLVIELKTM